MTLPVLVAMALIIAFAAGTQSITGFGFALIAVRAGVAPRPEGGGRRDGLGRGPARDLERDPVAARHPVTRGRHDLDRGLGRDADRVVGAPLADDQVLTATIGVTMVVVTAWLWHGLKVPEGRATELTAGFVSGTLATSVGTNGPPMVIAFQAAGSSRSRRATLQACFVGQGSIALALFWSRGLVRARRRHCVPDRRAGRGDRRLARRSGRAARARRALSQRRTDRAGVLGALGSSTHIRLAGGAVRERRQPELRHARIGAVNASGHVENFAIGRLGRPVEQHGLPVDAAALEGRRLADRGPVGTLNGSRRCREAPLVLRGLERFPAVSLRR